MRMHCYFGREYEKSYPCSYDIKSGEVFVVNIEYDIDCEVESQKGVKVYGERTSFENRDILLIDFDARTTFLLKNAQYAGSKTKLCSEYSTANCTFECRTWFSSSNAADIKRLPDDPMIKSVSIFSKMILSWHGNTDLIQKESNELLELSISKKRSPDTISICVNNMEKIEIGTIWEGKISKSSISFDFTGKIQLFFSKEENYLGITSYLNELTMYMQLYEPGAFVIDRIAVTTIEGTFDYVCPRYTVDIKQTKASIASVKCTLLEFLEKCYTRIPYRNSKNTIRNIPYVVINRYRSIEDNFLLYYRFIESYYKEQNEKTFIKRSVEKNLRDYNLNNSEIDTIVDEIIALRNHYVHSGYFIKNNTLEVHPKNKTKKAYEINNVDVEWIYDKTKMLRTMVIDIIFRDMLGFNSYRYR